MDVFTMLEEMCEKENVMCSYDNGQNDIPMQIGGKLINLGEEDGTIIIDVSNGFNTIRIEKEKVQGISVVDDMITIKMEDGAKYLINSF